MKDKVLSEQIENDWATRRTWFQVRDNIAHAFRALKDEDKEYRIKTSECLGCYYFNHGIAGSALTSYTCGICKKEDMYHNTAVPKFCAECAREHDICRQCGADMVDISEIPVPDYEKDVQETFKKGMEIGVIKATGEAKQVLLNIKHYEGPRKTRKNIAELAILDLDERIKKL